MKVLFVGDYYENIQCENLLRALATSKQLDVACRPLITKFFNKELFKEMENKTHNPEFVIQFVDSELLVYDSSFINIAYVNNLNVNCRKLNTMDEIWVPSKLHLNSLKNAGINKSIKIVPIPVDNSIFMSNNNKIEFNGNFTFYTYLEYEEQFLYLEKAFHEEFDSSEPVSLVLCMDNKKVDIDEIKKNLRINNDKKDILILGKENIRTIHNSCDVYVSVSTKGNLCSNILEAMGFGRTPIVPSWGANVDYINTQQGWIIDSVLGLSFKGENCSLPNLVSLKKSMREAYENKQSRNAKSEKCIERVLEISFGKVGNITKRTLYEFKKE